jgi:hypothetical protein
MPCLLMEKDSLQRSYSLNCSVLINGCGPILNQWSRLITACNLVPHFKNGVTDYIYTPS